MTELKEDRMANNKKNDVTYIVTVMGARGIIKLLLIVLVIIFFIFLARTSYKFGYSIFNERPMNAETPTEILVEIPKNASTLEIATILENNGLIENRFIFLLQERFSAHHGNLQPGKYYMNTGQTASQLLKILARVDTENQPEQEDDDHQELSAPSCFWPGPAIWRGWKSRPVSSMFRLSDMRRRACSEFCLHRSDPRKFWR